MKRTSLLLILLIAIAPVFSQILEPVEWSFEALPNDDGTYQLVFNAQIDKGWYVYSQDIPEDGPIPTTLNFDENSDVELIGKASESGAKVVEGMDKVFDMEIKKFAGTAKLNQKVKVINDTKVTGYLEFMTCDDTKCLPPQTVDFEFDLKTAKDEGNAKPVDEPEKEIEPEIEVKPITEENEVDNYADANPDNVQSNSIDIEQQIVEPIKWDLSASGEGNSRTIQFNASIDQGWYIYSQIVPEDGPIPTSIVFEEADGFSLSGETSESGKKVKTGYDKVFEMDIKKFAGEANFTQLIELNSEEKIKGYFEFMTCDDSKCLPPQMIDFVFNPKDNSIAFGEELLNETEATAGEFNYGIDKIDLDAPVNNCEIGAVEPNKKGKGLWNIFFLGFIGGLVALLTPCVFPMIPLTVSFFTKGSNDRSKGIKNAIIYGLSITAIYVILSTPFYLMDSINPEILNNISTNVYLNIFFFVIFVVFAISFFGYFEITMPSGLANKSASAENAGGLIGIFFMAITLALVSFSCTGPILGSLLAGALTSDGGAVQLTMGMLGFGLALGIPFALFAAFPGWLNSLPKSGGWLNTVKVVLGFLELALAIKFLSNADLVEHWGILKREVFFGAWILIGIGLFLYLIGVIKFPHDTPNAKLGPVRLGTAAIVFAFTIYLMPGLTNTPSANRALVSGFPPPLFYSIYEKDTHCPLGLNCFHDFEEAIDHAKEVNKPIMIDFTGWACVNCRKMEENVWPNDKIYSLINDNYILVSLYVDDREPLKEEKTVTYNILKDGVEEERTRKLRTVGDQWAFFETQYFNNNSQPYYALVTSDGTLLNTPRGYTPDESEYRAWLECGLDAFNQLASNR